ncbi:MAG: T9SS type A sorting domain-containing protein [Bacteroidota bacterium]
MKSVIHLLLLAFLPMLLTAQTRDCDPVVMSGTELPCMLGEAPADVVAFRYQNGSWQQIPVQIDERIVLDITAPYGEGTGDCYYKSREDVPWDVLFYADPNTYTGADVNDPNFDDDDELAFMAKDAGDIAPQNACPGGVVSTTKCQVTVRDPLDGNSILGYVYVFRQTGNLAQDAGQDYVDYDFDFGADYKQDYLVCVFEQPGSNPESSRVTTDNYSMHFSRRWVKDELQITAGNASGVDILDHHQYFINVNSCNRNEVTFSNGKGPIIANIDGPVRAIRSVMGANSGTFMQLDIIFTECRTDNRMYYRLHPANGYYDAFDLNTNAIGMTFYNDQNTEGVMIDGNRDNLIKDDPNEWELMSGSPGSIVATYVFDTDLQLGTEAEYDQGLVEGFVAAYQTDLGPGEPRECTGDQESYNASGFCLRTKECTDLRYDFDDGPNCAPEFVRYFDQIRYHYMLPPQTTKAEAAQYASFAKNPLTTTANAQSCDGNQQPTCNDGIQNGDEEGVDCGGSNCSPCMVEPTCDDGIQNGDEEGVDCGGSNCPPCIVEPTCDDGIQNGDEEGVDCGGSNCPPCMVETCDAPTGLFETNNTGSSVTLNWAAVSSANSYMVQGRQAGTSAWRLNQSSNTNSTTISNNIVNGLTYEWRVRANCDGEDSPYSEIETFTAGDNTGNPTCDDGIQNGDEEGVDCGGSNCPPCMTDPTCDDGIQNGDEEGIDCGGSNCPPCMTDPTCDDGIQNGLETGVDCGGPDCPACPTTCETPSNLRTTNIRNTRATLEWDGVDGALSYTFEIRAVGEPNWVERTVTRTFQRVQPLLSGTLYEWRIRANCDGENSPYSAITTFTTTGSSAQAAVEQRTETIKQVIPLVATAYPSPTSDLLNIQFNKTVESIEIIDMMGKIVQLPVSASDANSIQLEVQNLVSGYYLIRLKAENEVKVLRFVKE